MNSQDHKTSVRAAGIDRRTALAAMAIAGMSGPLMAQAVRGVTANSIKVGVTLGITGPVAVVIEQLRAGMFSYIKMINDRGGVNGRKIDLIFEDNEYSAQKGVTAVRKLVLRDDIFALLGSNGTAQINPVVDFLKENNVPIINSYTGTLDWFEPAKPHIYGVFTPLEYSAQAVGRWVAKDGHKKILVPYFDAAYSKSFTAYAETGAKSVDPNVQVEFMPIKLGTVDYVPHALEMIRKKPDAIIGATIVAEFLSMVKELRTQGSSIPVYTQPFNVFQSLVQTAPKEMEGIKGFSYTQSPLTETPAVKEYRDTLTRLVPGQKPDFVSMFGWGAAKVFVEALSRVKGDLTLPAFYDALNGMKGYDSGIFPPVSFSAANHQGTTALFKVVTRNGNWVSTGEYVDGAKNTW